MAVDDDFLRKNPLAFELASAIVNDSVTREVNTRKQQIDLFDKIRGRSISDSEGLKKPVGKDAYFTDGFTRLQEKT